MVLETRSWRCDVCGVHSGVLDAKYDAKSGLKAGHVHSGMFVMRIDATGQREEEEYSIIT